MYEGGMNDLPNLVLATEQPPDDVEFHTIDSVFIKQMRIAKAGTFIPQHSHVYEHASMLAKGSVRVYEDGKMTGEHSAPTCLSIKAGVKHTFESLEDDTIIYCIHNLMRSEIVEILEEHQLVGGR
jgi:quercetin dioxygenase-like cupin family protein